MKKRTDTPDLFVENIPLADGVITSVVLLPEQAKVYFTTEIGVQTVFTFEQVASVWDHRSAGQEIGGMITIPVHRSSLHIQQQLQDEVQTGELQQEQLESLSVYSFVSSWNEQPLIEIAAIEIKVGS